MNMSYGMSSDGAAECDRVAAVHGLGYRGDGLHSGHHNYQLPLFGLAVYTHPRCRPSAAAC